MKISEKGLLYRTSRRAYFWNYVIISLIAVFFYLLTSHFNVNFSIAPRTLDQMMQTFLILGMVGVASFLFEEPILEGILKRYHITNNEIEKIEGIFRKKKLVIPMQNIADVSIKKGVIGRILNFGDVDVRGFKDEFTMKGMANPEEIQKILQAKINLLRGTSGGMSRIRRPDMQNESQERI